MPPPIKVYEAIGAIGDGRVRAIDNDDAPGAWDVVSSEGAKTYRVELSADGREISSNDNASYWQGYLGYPAIAVLIARGTLARAPRRRARSPGFPGKSLTAASRTTTRARPPRSRASWPSGGGDFDAIRAEAAAILDALAAPARAWRRGGRADCRRIFRADSGNSSLSSRQGRDI